MESFDYEQETIFGKAEETLGSQEVEVTFDVEQPWGDSRIRVRYSSYFNDLGKYSTSVFGNLSFRVVRGLSLNVSASTSLVRDQLYLGKTDLTDKEILIQRRQLATDSAIGSRSGSATPSGRSSTTSSIHASSRVLCMIPGRDASGWSPDATSFTRRPRPAGSVTRSLSATSMSWRPTTSTSPASSSSSTGTAWPTPTTSTRTRTTTARRKKRPASPGWGRLPTT